MNRRIIMALCLLQAMNAQAMLLRITRTAPPVAQTVVRRLSQKAKPKNQKMSFSEKAVLSGAAVIMVAGEVALAGSCSYLLFTAIKK